jgi:hypothetical protein
MCFAFRVAGNCPGQPMDTTLYQCTCASCGQVIEYRANQAGLIINCPKCDEKSQLPSIPAAPERDAFYSPPPDIPEFKECPICRTRLDLAAKSCSTCDAENRRKKRTQLFIIIGASSFAALCAIGLAGIFLLRFFARPAKPVSAGHIYFEQAVPRGPKSIKDLSPGKFVLEKKRGNDLLIGVGDVSNVSEFMHFDIKIDLDVLDKNGAKIGTVSDYCSVLAPHTVWHVIATVEKPGAMSVRFGNLSETK